jgi:hypothetical protein
LGRGVVDVFSSCYKWYAASAHRYSCIAIHPVVTTPSDLLTRNLLNHFTSYRAEPTQLLAAPTLMAAITWCRKRHLEFSVHLLP